MLDLKRVEIENFRGYLGKQIIEFDAPITIFFGDNGRGKSSTLNAIEWCLLGKKAIGKGKTNLQEREKWKVSNLHGHQKACVTLWLGSEGEDRLYSIRRSEQGNRIEFSDGTNTLSQEAAEERIAQIVSDFAAMAGRYYLHQEKIREILIESPGKIEQLIRAFSSESCEIEQVALIVMAMKKFLNQKTKELLQHLEAAKSEIARDYHTRKMDFLRQLPDLNRADKSLDETRDLLIANANQLLTEGHTLLKNPTSASEWPMPAPLTANNAIERIPSAATELEQRLQMVAAKRPPLEFLTDLKIAINRLTNLLSDYQAHESAGHLYEQRITTLQQELRASDSLELLKQSRDQKKSQQAQQAGLVAMLTDAIAYLERESLAHRTQCPLCEGPHENLLPFLKSKLAHSLLPSKGPLETEIQKIQSSIEEIQSKEIEMEQLRVKLAQRDHALTQIQQQFNHLFPGKLTPQSHPPAIMKITLAELLAQQQHLNDEVANWGQIQKRVHAGVARLGELGQLLRQSERIFRINDPTTSPDYQRAVDRLAIILRQEKMLEDVAQIVTTQSSQAKSAFLNQFKESISSIYKTITNNRTIEAVAFNEKYDFIDQQNNSLIQILNQGDLNALALAFFQSVARSRHGAQDLGCIIFDDPTQSLGSEYKKNFVLSLNQLMDELSNQQKIYKKIIISTMDSEFKHLLETQLTKKYKLITLNEWDAHRGVTFQIR